MRQMDGELMRAVLSTYSKLLEEIQALKSIMLDGVEKRSAACSASCGRGADAVQDPVCVKKEEEPRGKDGMGASPSGKRKEAATRPPRQKTAFPSRSEKTHGGLNPLVEDRSRAGKASAGPPAKGGAQENLLVADDTPYLSAHSPGFETPRSLSPGDSVGPGGMSSGQKPRAGSSGKRARRNLLFSSQLLKNNSYRAPVSVGHKSLATAPKRQYSYSFFEALEREVQEL